MVALQLRHPSVAVLTLLAATPGQTDLPPRIDAALTRARPALMDHLRAATRSGRPGELALLLLAASDDGVAADDPDFVAGVRRLARANATDTYELSLRLMVLAATPTVPDRLALARQDTEELLRHRNKRGPFTYRPSGTDWDLSNTQYAALGLRAAAAMAVPIEPAVWIEMAREIGRNQSTSGGFAYQRLDRGFDRLGYASMTAAGIAVLAICRQAIDVQASGGPSIDGADELVRQIDGQITQGWRWFADHQEVIGNIDERWCFYFHYGLERAAILTDVTEIGGIDWHAKGAEMLLAAQLEGGGWISDADDHPGGRRGRKLGNAVPTAFAVLFLRRSFQKQLQPITPHVVRLVNIGARSEPDQVQACSAELVRRGKQAMPELLRALRSEIEPRRRAAVGALVSIAGEAFGYDAALDAHANRRAVRRAELWYLRNR